MEPEEGHLGEDPLPEAQVGEEGALGLNGLLVKEGLLPSPLHEAVAHGVKEEALLPRGEVVLLEEGEGPPGQGHRLSAAEGEAVGVQGLHGAVVGVGEGAGVGPGGLGLPEGAKEPLPQGLGRLEEGLLGQGEKAEEGVGPPPQGGEALEGGKGPEKGLPGRARVGGGSLWAAARARTARPVGSSASPSSSKRPSRVRPFRKRPSSFCMWRRKAR